MKGVKKHIAALLLILAASLGLAAFSTFKAPAFASEIELIIKANNHTYKYSGEEIGYYKGKYFLKCAKGVVDTIYYDTLTPAIDAEITFIPELKNPFTITNESYGKAINRTALLEDVSNALNGGNFIAHAKFFNLKPKITANELKALTFTRASFKTEYPYSSENRKLNIRLAASKINGTILENGKEFSFNKTVGKRSEENGFKNAVVIENGVFSDGIGGGVCQVSTTLYNAALLAGLTTTERHAHSLLPSYIEPSFDAMVSDTYSDLKFKNQTGGTVFIKAETTDASITYTIYGKKLINSYERLSVSKESILPDDDELINDEELYIGNTEVIRQRKEGLKSEGYLIEYLNGERVKTIKLHSDVYKSIRAQIKVGVKEPDY